VPSSFTNGLSKRRRDTTHMWMGDGAPGAKDTVIRSSQQLKSRSGLRRWPLRRSHLPPLSLPAVPSPVPVVLDQHLNYSLECAVTLSYICVPSRHRNYALDCAVAHSHVCSVPSPDPSFFRQTLYNCTSQRVRQYTEITQNNPEITLK